MSDLVYETLKQLQFGIFLLLIAALNPHYCNITLFFTTNPADSKVSENV